MICYFGNKYEYKNCYHLTINLFADCFTKMEISTYFFQVLFSKALLKYKMECHLSRHLHL